MAEEKLDTRIKRSRLLLQGALIELMSEQGFEGVTVLDITKRATLNRSTFYLHYSDKVDLLYQTLHEVMDELRQCFTPVPHNQLQSEEPYPGFINLFEHVAKHVVFYRTMLSDKGFHGFYHQLMRVVKECYAQIIDLYKDAKHWDVPVDFFAHYISSAHLGVVTWWLQNDQPYPPRYMAIQLTRLTKSTANDMSKFSHQ